MNRKVFLVWLGSCVAALIWLAPARASALQVVATVPSLAALAKDVGGSRTSVKSLALATQDPHFVDAKPSLALELNKADLLLAVGLDLEIGWLPVLQTGARNPAIAKGAKGYLECSQFVRLLEIPQQVDRSMGDIHPGGNPHYLHDPRAAADVARGISARLVELDPGGKAEYEASLKAFLEKLDKARAGWEAQLAASRGQPVIGYHKTLAYLADWLGLRPVEYLEPKPGVPPSPAHVAHVLLTAKKLGVKVVLHESYYPSETAKLVADKSGARLVSLPGGADFAAGQSYVDHVGELVARLEKGFAR
jgi:zinc/manganese transport system substrate-binding protein